MTNFFAVYMVPRNPMPIVKYDTSKLQIEVKPVQYWTYRLTRTPHEIWYGSYLTIG